MNTKNISNDIIKNFNDYKMKIKEISQDILNLKNIEYDNEIKDYIKSENEINLFYEFVFFANYSRYIPLNLDYTFHDNNNKKIFNKYIKSNNDIYRINYHMHIYYLYQIENIIISTNNDYEIKLKLKDINQYYSILIHILSILYKLYQEKIYDLKKVLIFFDIIIIFIKRRNKIHEKFVKLKKMIFFDLLFEKYFKYFIPLVLKKTDNKNEDIILFLKYIIKALNSKELNSYYNYEILSDNEIISKFISTLLNDINYQENFDIYNEYKPKLLDSFTNIFKNNITHSNFFEELINHNKNAFINLMNYKTRKEQIINDIYMENFYIELLNKLFSNENSKESLKIKLEENYFRFNGYNSKMTFQLYQFNLCANSVLFFSFQLNEPNIDTIQNNSNISPLLFFNSNSGKDVLSFKLYIQKENKINKLYIYREKGGKKNKIICLDKLGNIKINTQYILSIKFMGKKIAIFMKQVDKKGAQFDDEFDSLDCEYSSPVLKIGHDDDKNEYFDGYIGPIIIIKNIVLKKNSKIENIINNILNLNNLYHYFPMFLSSTSFYHFDEKIIFSSIKEENEFNNIKLFLQDNLLDFLCEIYLTPEILGIYHSLFMKNEIKEKFIIFEIPNICDEKTYIINDINTSLKIHSSTYNNFIRNNGFDYFILMYEYIYQFLYLMNSNKNEFDFYYNNNLENIFIDIINSTIIIMHENYLYYKHYIYNTKKLKTLYMNLYEILRMKNHKILDGISQELYYFSFDFILEYKKLKNIINDVPNNKYLIEEEKIISSFAYGLTKMIFDFELYQKDIQNNSMALLFLISNKTLMEYKNNHTPNKIFPFEEGFFFWILKFINVFAKEFESDNDNKNIIIKNFFELIEKYIEVVDNLMIKKSYFRHLFILIKYNENNLTIIKYILNVIYNIIYENFLLDKEEIGFLINLIKEPNTYEEKENNINNNKFIDINISICKILIKQIFLDKSKEILIKINDKLAKLKNIDDVISAITSELSKYLNFFLNYNKKKDNEELAYIIKYMDIYENIFNFILDLLKIIITQNEKESSTINASNSDTKENSNFFKIIDLLNHLNEILKNKIYQNIYVHRIFCIINFIKFYYRMISFEKKIFLYSDVKFIENFLQIIELSYKYCLINSSTIFKFIISNQEFNKTLIEIIFEIFLELCFSDECSIQCYNLLLDKYACPFFDRQFIDNHKYSIFYVTDNLNYFLIKKKTKDLDADLKKKCKIISFFNQLFIKQESFSGNFSTYFLLVIIDSQKKINDKKDFNNMPKYKLEELLNDLYSLILEEHILLYKADKKYFFKTNPSNFYNEALIYIKDKHVKKKSKAENFNKFLETIFEKMNKEKNKALNINKHISDDIKENQEDINVLSDTNEIEQININYNKTIFFYELDKYNVTNIKKEIMNCIFSVYYLDEFFYSKDFCVVKKYYMNNYINDLEYIHSKKLNFPSIIKNYRNNLEPPLFIKKFNNYIVDPYFSITHSYIENETLKRNLSMDKNIKLNKKDIKPLENDESIECEILKNEQGFFGKLYYNNFKGYLLFKEEKSNFGDNSGYKYIFLMSKFTENNKNIIQKNFDKSVLILLDEVEELIEMRILLLWKGFEIFLKNGKSYVFNFLTTNDYDNFMKNFVFKSRINNLVRKRNFLSDKTITKAWVNGLISNFDYILILNRYGSRSYNDPTQYPIFPWLLNNYHNFQEYLENEKYILKVKYEYIKQKKKQKKANNITSKIKTTLTINTHSSKNINEIRTNSEIINNLEKNMQLLNEKKIDNKTYNDFITNEDYKFRSIIRDFRYLMAFQTEKNRKTGQRNYEEDIERKNFPTHTGCHYSNSGFVYYYLMRQQPYGNLLVKLQEFQTENPNRCFMNIAELEDFMVKGTDNRELIPELFTKIECFLNLNCDYYGKLVHAKNESDLLDDCIMTDIIDIKDKSYLSSFVSFILQHKKIMNSKLIGLHLNKWIDTIFGCYQFPPENIRKESYNITSKYSYEQTTNLEKKLEKKKKKEGLGEVDIILKLNLIITYIISFGVTPSLLFNEIHPQMKFQIKENINKDKKNKRKGDEKSENSEINELGNIEDSIYESLTPDILSFQIKGTPIYFEINPTINKVFIYIKDQGNLEILENELYNEISYKYFSFLKYNKIEKSNILYENINSVYQIKYGFSSFYKEFTTHFGVGNYHTYYYDKINELLSNEKILDEYRNFKFNEIMVITCRHIDFSFKIYYLDKDVNDKNNKKKNIINKIYSYICEDFVTSCCCISSNAFIIGLNNGKLIYYIIKENPIILNDKKKIEQSDNIIIEKDKYIQAHKGKINSIDIDKRLGIVITSGDDNYIFIRKLYDFELLLPIKIKNKFTILMTKVSSYNFLYVLCFNKVNFKNIIFGYTLSGLKFAKSEYGRYDNISINEDGNILTMNYKEELLILSGNDLKRLNNLNDKEIIDEIKNLKHIPWLQFDYFNRSKEAEHNEIITCLKNKMGANYIKTININSNKINIV